MSFDVNIDTAVSEFKIEMTHLEWDTDLRNAFQCARPIDFYSL
jgi:hypothetical protein